MEKIIKSTTKLREIMLENKNNRVVITAGVFDLIHPGHTRALQKCKSMGDLLVVIIDCDKRVEMMKGKGRPVLTQKERAEVLAAIDAVDYVFLHKEPLKDPIIQLSLIASEFVENTICWQSKASLSGNEKRIRLTQLCKEVVIHPLCYTSSTTKIVEKIRKM